MTNRIRPGVLISVLSLAGCAGKAPEAPQFPKEITTGLHTPGWELQSTAKADVNAAPDEVKAAHPAEAWAATYTGPVTAHARVWSVSGPAVALELVQHWRPEADTVVFFNDRYFIAVDYQPVDRNLAAALVLGLEKALGPPRE